MSKDIAITVTDDFRIRFVAPGDKEEADHGQLADVLSNWPAMVPAVTVAVAAHAQVLVDRATATAANLVIAARSAAASAELSRDAAAAEASNLKQSLDEASAALVASDKAVALKEAELEALRAERDMLGA